MLDSVIILSLSRGLKYNENIFRKAGDRKIHTTIRGSKKNLGIEKSSGCLWTVRKSVCWEQNGQRRVVADAFEEGYTNQKYYS